MKDEFLKTTDPDAFDALLTVKAAEDGEDKYIHTLSKELNELLAGFQEKHNIGDVIIAAGITTLETDTGLPIIAIGKARPAIIADVIVSLALQLQPMYRSRIAQIIAESLI